MLNMLFLKVELNYFRNKAALRKAAIERGIPPEVLKAVALTESGQLKQFNADGTPKISADGGIGLMQVTDSTFKDVRKRTLEIRYNL